MVILNNKIKLADLPNIEVEQCFPDMAKAVVDVKKEIIAVNGDLHVDLEQLLLGNGSKQSSLYGINILYENGEIEFDSMINPPRNRDDGYPRHGRDVASPEKRALITEIVKKWIEQ